MKLLILIYYYYDEGYNVLDTMKVFPYVDLIKIRKRYDFYHVNTLVRTRFNLNPEQEWIQAHVAQTINL